MPVHEKKKRKEKIDVKRKMGEYQQGTLNKVKADKLAWVTTPDD